MECVGGVGLAVTSGGRQPGPGRQREGTLHFGRAAARVAIAQPALSKSIQRIESRLRVQLFDRTSRSVALTPAGVALLEHGRHALNAMTIAVQNAQRAAGEEPLRFLIKPVQQTVETYGRLDLAVNNAGVPAIPQELTEVTAQAWERVLRIDLTGTFFSLKHEIPELRRSDGGAIVNIASGAGLHAVPRSAAYVAGKHGVVGLTKAAAVGYARDGIRVNALAPGMTRTAALDRLAEGTGMIAQHEALTPLGRLGTPEEVADAAIWLCSDESSYVTGTTLAVDGGRRA
jgi:NAD(P)-dependent dehydrogenase (short-subunit alcohol dehydrogenase family)